MTTSEMTDQQINAAIAEIMKVHEFVGLKKRGYWYRPEASGYTSEESEAGRFTMEEAKKHEYPHDEPVTIERFSTPNYTTDPAAAMEVLKKCADRTGVHLGALIDMPFGKAQQKPNRYSISNSCDEDADIQVESDTLEKAICLFALEIWK